MKKFKKERRVGKCWLAIVCYDNIYILVKIVNLLLCLKTRVIRYLHHCYNIKKSKSK